MSECNVRILASNAAPLPEIFTRQYRVTSTDSSVALLQPLGTDNNCKPHLSPFLATRSLSSKNNAGSASTDIGTQRNGISLKSYPFQS